MATYTFSTPAKISDFPAGSTEQNLLEQKWDLALTGYTKAAVVSNPWNVDYQAPCDWYVDPTQTTVPDAPVVPIFWTAFPNRLKTYFLQDEKSPYKLSPMQVYALGDFGNIPQSQAFPTGLPFIIPGQTCPNLNWQQSIDQWKAYDPNGPRGWLDEYCEWAVTRNDEGKITKVSFCCENPEYWYSLWQVSPQKVLELYQQLVHPNVKIEDLYLPAIDGNGYTIDPVTGIEAYNPLNKWNAGTIATAEGGGAVHLTSPPNTIGAEVLLAAQATLLRDLPPVDYNMQRLVCAGAFGRPYRNSDPHIGLQVNQLVKNVGVMITLTNPLGLYIQKPDFSNYTTPDGTDPASFYKVIRGTTAAENGTAYDQILHAEFSVPEALGYTVSDILIGHEVVGSSADTKPVPILFAGQIAETFHVCLAGTGVTPIEGTPAQVPLPAVQSRDGNVNGQAIMLLAENVQAAMLAVNPFPPFVQLPSPVKPGGQLKGMALQVDYPNSNFDDAVIAFWNEDGTTATDITHTVNAVTASDGTPAGSSQASDSLYNYLIDITVGVNASSGLKGVTITNPLSVETPVPLPGILYVEKQG